MGQARIFGQTAVSGGGGLVVNIAFGSELPSVVVDGQLFIVTDQAITNFYVATNIPAAPVAGDVWVQVREGTTIWELTNKSPFVHLALVAAQYYDGLTWTDVEAHLGANGVWVQFSWGFPPVGTALQDMSWADIALISAGGKADDYFQVGDQKTISIGGVSYAVEIVGFDHDDLSDGSGKAGITFGMVDCLNTTYQMNTSNTNAGGWGSCALRGTLQSTIFNQLLADLQAVIKPVKKLASAGSQSTTINSYDDTLFLFSEQEIFGAKTHSTGGEGTQYVRFATTTSRVKKANGSAARWWGRSPSAGDSSSFCGVSVAGTASINLASNSYGVAFGFCV